MPCAPRLARVASETSLSKPQLMESRRLARCLLAYIRHHHGEIQPLFELFSAFLVREGLCHSTAAVPGLRQYRHPAQRMCSLVVAYNPQSTL